MYHHCTLYIAMLRLHMNRSDFNFRFGFINGDVHGLL